MVTPGAASTLKVTGFPTTDTAGTAGTFTVTAYDAYGNVATGYTGTVHFTSTDSQAILPATTTITPEDQGTTSVTATLKTAGTQSITATDTANANLKGTESGIDVTPAAASVAQRLRLPEQPRRRQRVQLHGHRSRCLWQRGHRLFGDGDSDQHRPERFVLVDYLYLHCRRRRKAHLFCHAANRRDSIDHGVRLNRTT